MADIFISYTREDRSRAGQLARALEDLGWSVWWDRKIIAGQTFDQVIERELDAAKSVVVLWSQDSLSSEWVKSEAASAAERKVLIPVLIDDVKLPLEFRRNQAADLVDWDGDPSHEGFQSLREGVAAKVGVPPLRSTTPSRRSRVRWNRLWALGALAAIAVVLGSGAYWGLSVTPQPSPQSSHTAKTTAPKLPLSSQFANIVSGEPNLKKIKDFVGRNKVILDGAPQYLAGRPLIEDVSEFPVNAALKPDFTRFNFQPDFSQIPNYILFIDFVSPQTAVFGAHGELSGVTKSASARMDQYISSARVNYNDYTARAARLKGFKIPLATMQGRFPASLEGIIVIGRRNLLSVEQLEYLSKNNETSSIRIITYDSLIEFLEQAELKAQAQSNAGGGN
jgi:TIR domain/Domain of unknown function (DUF4263)